jgi:hypothetical protein
MTEPIDPRRLRPGPNRNKSLPPEMLDKIRAVYGVIGAHLEITLEEFEAGFMRDTHPENEVTAWQIITATWLRYHETFLSGKTLPKEKEEKLVAALISISAGVDDPERLEVPFEIGRKLLQSYAELSRE